MSLINLARKNFTNFLSVMGFVVNVYSFKIACLKLGLLQNHSLQMNHFVIKMQHKYGNNLWLNYTCHFSEQLRLLRQVLYYILINSRINICLNAVIYGGTVQ